jgi:trimeric autotransporter adhesin
MESRLIETGARRAAMLGRATILTVTVLAGGCAQVIGIEDLPPLPVDAAPQVAPDAAPQVTPDARPSGFAVRGVATGVLGPVALELRIDGDSELLAVTQDGPFAFATRLEDGASYTVLLVNPDVPCTLRDETGVIAGADTAIELTCTGASLASVSVSGVAPAVTLVSGTADYVVELPLLQQSVTLTASVATAGDTLTIAGTPVASGAPSAEFTLSLGDNPVDIVVENDLGWRRTYRLTLRRAAQLAQYAYGKASNTGASDLFGYRVALSGDTLAVGARYEASAAQGVGGNQGDNSALESGAVYVFRRTGSTWTQEAYLKVFITGARGSSLIA